MLTVSQVENHHAAWVQSGNSTEVPPRQRLTIAEADIIFYGDNALAGAKEFATLEVGQGFECMTPGMGQAAATVFVRRGTWALYDQEAYHGRMTIVSPGGNDLIHSAIQQGLHILDAPVCSYKRIL
jgi:hypothetical protein